MTVEAPLPDTTPRADGSVPVTLLHDRILVREDADGRERRSMGGIVIPLTAQVGKRLSWARVVAVGPHVRNVSLGARVLFEPEDRSQVELDGIDYIMLRERDIHAVATAADPTSGTGLYL